MAITGVVSFWVFPLLSSLVWMGMLLGMLLSWVIEDKYRHYDTMASRATIAFISNIGADRLQPLFITGCILTACLFDVGLIAEPILRLKGRLVLYKSTSEKVLCAFNIFFAVVGTVGLICLSIFRTGWPGRLHWVFLSLFIVGYLLSAIFLCAMYQRMAAKNPEHPELRASFLVKLVFIILEMVLLVCFLACRRHKRDMSAIFEWTISFVFSFYVFHFVMDLYPAVHTVSLQSRFIAPVEDEKPGSPRPSSSASSRQNAGDMA
ncbi:unnamed protein product [Clonostachys byssicola]|uniref:CWH43-like N-terminal domain-containing protein n=1 Tax=Clonostachys byssicola TaxID=160290 RepID=A0A9N9XTS9_9HYPO|nr:unnamed protein product [Clonostachys byssicola]